MTWSTVEIQERLETAADRLGEAVDELRVLGSRQAQSKWAYEKAWAQCVLTASGRGSNKEEREAIAMQSLIGLTNDRGIHPGLDKDLSANAYADQRKVIEALQSDIDIGRTLLVSARSLP